MRAGAISVTERAAYIGRIRNLARSIAQSYYDSRERLDFPMASREAVAELRARNAVKVMRRAMPVACEGRMMSETATLLVELLTEELPPKRCGRLALSS
jgi:hypothetical protein